VCEREREREIYIVCFRLLLLICYLQLCINKFVGFFYKGVWWYCGSNK